MTKPRGLSHSENTRLALIDAAEEVFSKKGYDRATVADIAKAAHVNVSLVSYHFGGKEKLYLACLERFALPKLESTCRLLTPPESPEDFKVKLRLWIELQIESHLEREKTAILIFREMNDPNPITKKLFQKIFLKMFKALCVFFEGAQNKGILKKSLNPQFISQIFFGSLIHSLQLDRRSKEYLSLTLKDLHYRKQFIDHLLTIHLKGSLQEPL